MAGLREGQVSTGTLPAPVAVWDCNDPGGTWRRHMAEASEWAKEHLPRAADTFLAAFYLIDAPFAVVHRVRRNENGRAYTDPATGEIATEPPATVMLDELPPAHLLEACGGNASPPAEGCWMCRLNLPHRIPEQCDPW